MSLDRTTLELSRRRLLAGLGTAGAVTLGAALPGNAEPLAFPAGDVVATPSRRSATGAAVFDRQLVPGLTYRVLDPSVFHPVLGSQLRAVSTAIGGTTLNTPGPALLGHLDLPVGVVLRELAVTYIAPSGSAPNWARLFRKALTGGYQTVVEQNPLAQGPDPRTVTFALNEAVDGSSSYAVGYLVATTGQFVNGVVIGYEEPTPPTQPTPPPAFVAVSPTPRVLDTRQAGGKLNADEERVVALGVPGTAAAAVINLTITETEDAGYIAIFPSDISWPGNSSINWSSTGQNLANTVVTAVDPSGQIRMRGGVKSSHVVIDVLGYFS